MSLQRNLKSHSRTLALSFLIKPYCQALYQLFVLEYLGPLITLPLGYYFSNNRSDTAKFGAVLGIIHFLKRELESQYVHIFSNASVPVSGSFKNFFHYWVIYGLIVMGELFFFKTKSSDWPRGFYWVFTAIILLLEFLNYKCHCVLRDLRLGSDGKVDPHKRGIPKVCSTENRAGVLTRSTVQTTPTRSSCGSPIRS